LKYVPAAPTIGKNNSVTEVISGRWTPAPI
jgi:hypothetical protein